MAAAGGKTYTRGIFTHSLEGMLPKLLDLLKSEDLTLELSTITVPHPIYTDSA